MFALVLASLSLVQRAAPVQTQVAGVVGPTYRFGDYDGDGLADVYAVRPSARDRLYRNLGDGTFVDITDSVGLSDVSGTRLALWQDFDGDGALDLYVCAANGRSRLFKNEAHASFVDVTLAAGVGHRDGEELFAEWIDFDLDGWSDLHVVTARGDRLWRNLREGRFEASMLPQFDDVDATVIALSLPQSLAQSASSLGATDETGMGGPLGLVGNRCPKELKDAATGNCVPMSTVPAVGQLYPLSTNLNVDLAGNVGMGTTTPGQKLDVSGNLRASGQLMSSVATGTAPLTVSSTTKVTNLNADTLDGVDSAAFSQLGATIEGTEITDGTVDAADLAGSSVTTGKLASNSVTSGKISDGTIASVDIGTNAVTSAHIAAGSVGGSHLANGAVGTFQLAADAVDSSRVLDGSIALVDHAGNSVDGSKIVDGSVDTADLTGSSVTSGKISNGTIQAADIGNGQITNPLLGALSVGNSNLQLGAVGLPNLNTTGATTGQMLGFNGSGAAWMSAPTTNWTPISSLPYTISTPGAYYVTGNLTGVAGSDGITITAPDVWLDLNGFAISGPAGGTPLSGIYAGNSANRLTVRNGSVIGWGYGVALSCATVALSDLRAGGNAGTGVFVTDAQGTIQRCIFDGNSTGLDAYGIVIEQCTASNNTGTGFAVGYEAVVRGCTAQYNANGIDASNRCVISDNLSYQNLTNDINLASGSATVLIRNTAGTYSIAAGNLAGPLVTSATIATSTNPHANYDI